MFKWVTQRELDRGEERFEAAYGLLQHELQLWNEDIAKRRAKRHEDMRRSGMTDLEIAESDAAAQAAYEEELKNAPPMSLYDFLMS